MELEGRGLIGAALRMEGLASRLGGYEAAVLRQRARNCRRAALVEASAGIDCGGARADQGGWQRRC